VAENEDDLIGIGVKLPSALIAAVGAIKYQARIKLESIYAEGMQRFVREVQLAGRPIVYEEDRKLCQILPPIGSVAPGTSAGLVLVADPDRKVIEQLAYIQSLDKGQADEIREAIAAVEGRMRANADAVRAGQEKAAELGNQSATAGADTGRPGDDSSGGGNGSGKDSGPNSEGKKKGPRK